MKEESKFQELFAPTVVLGCICLVASLLLAITYQITKPKIDEITIKNANAARAEVMPEADGFTALDLTEEQMAGGVTEYYVADNGSGVVITSSAKGFGGTITVMTAIDPTGTIEAIKVTSASDETPGLGAKVVLSSHTDKFKGAKAITTDPDATDAQYIKPLTGASYSSKGVFNAVSAALDLYGQIGGAQ